MTYTLVDVLRDWINKPSFSAASLHTEILFRLKLKEKKKRRDGVPLEWCMTPIHWINAKDCKAVGIKICRRNVRPLPSTTSDSSSEEEQPSTFVDAMDIDFDDANSSLTPLSSVSSTGCCKVPHVLITLQLDENQSLDTGQTARWLDRLPLLAKWAKVEAVFPSYSTLIIMSVPLPIWDMLPDHPACSFIEYVNGPSVGCPSRSEAKPSALSLSTPMEGDNTTSFDSPGTRQLSIKRIESSTLIGQCSKPETPPADIGSSSSIKVPRDTMRERAAREGTRKADQERKEALEGIREEESFSSVQRQRNETMWHSLGKGRFATRVLYQPR